MHRDRRLFITCGAMFLAASRRNGPTSAGFAAAFASAATADTLPASYRATLRSRWTAVNFPTRFPDSAHLTGLVGATHRDTVSFWAEGRAATLGIKNVAERGRKPDLLEEVAQAIALGTAHSALSGGDVPAGASEVRLDFPMDRAFPLVTLVSMLGPSPDWFTGVNAVPLYVDGRWLASLELPLRVYDAGTDDGVDFESRNAASAPRGLVTRLSTDAAHTDLLDGVHRTTGTSLATLRFDRLA